MSFKLIAGLGNPGRQYESTRHNIGFMLLDRMATAEGTEFKEITRWQSELAKLQDGSWLIKPQTFMNLSGRALQQVMNFYKLEPREILVIYDDASLPLGTLRFREKGSAGGHNGIKSIIAQISTQEFPRLKIGIGGSGPADMSSHVLGKFSEEEGPMLENTLARALDAVQLARTKGISEASNKFHQKPAPEPQAEKPDDETDEDSPGSERII
ncbi:MAG: aminoacyl-tRNA hydrolase [Akkermansiaceae bacterium]|nr:aminoacyl-tRNA hydrolase [Akkermansiaceae bacterium]